MYKETRIGNHWVNYGYSKRFALGFSIDKYSITLDFFSFWITIER